MVPENIFKDQMIDWGSRHSVEAGSKPQGKKKWAQPVASSGPTSFSSTEPCCFSLWSSGFLGFAVSENLAKKG